MYIEIYTKNIHYYIIYLGGKIMIYNVKDTLFSQMGTKRIFDKNACGAHTYIDSKHHIAYIATFPGSPNSFHVFLSIMIQPP